MGQRSRSRVRGIVEDHPRSVSPGAAALGVLAMAMSGMIVWNAFFGIHDSSMAPRKLVAIPPGASTRVVVEAPSSPAKTITITYSAQVEDVQRELSATGHFRGLVDGVMGKQTALAIKKYQSDNDLAVTGVVSKDLLSHIRYTRKVLAASEFTGSVTDAASASSPRTFKAKIVRKPAKVTNPPDDSKGLAVVRDVQRRLGKLGYDIAAVTGEPDADLRSAVLKFQLDNGLAMDGTVSQELLSVLKIVEAGQAASSQ